MVSIVPPSLPVLIFVNKMDAENSLCSNEIMKAMRLEVILKGREWACIEASVKKRDGIEEVLRWLGSKVT